MSYEEVEDLTRRNHLFFMRPYAIARYAYRLLGRAIGWSAHDEFQVPDLFRAWRDGRLATRLWIRRVLGFVGGSLLIFGIFAIVFAIAPPSIKLLIAVAIVYAAVRTAHMLWRAGHA